MKESNKGNAIVSIIAIISLGGLIGGVTILVKQSLRHKAEGILNQTSFSFFLIPLMMHSILLSVWMVNLYQIGATWGTVFD